MSLSTALPCMLNTVILVSIDNVLAASFPTALSANSISLMELDCSNLICSRSNSCLMKTLFIVLTQKTQ